MHHATPRATFLRRSTQRQQAGRAWGRTAPLAMFAVENDRAGGSPLAAHLRTRLARRARNDTLEPSQAENRIRRLEAVLFLAKEPLNSRKLAKLANLTDGAEARRLVRRLMTQLDAARCAFQVAEVGGGFCLMTRPVFAPWLAKLRGAPEDVRLSTPAMETLAIVAYRQPVLRTDVEAIRGVGCNEILRQLMERELLRIVGRSEELGRPFLYGTTKQFLTVFGLRSLDELPPLPENGTELGATTNVAGGLAVASKTQPQENEMTTSVMESIESEIDPTHSTDIGAPAGVLEIAPRSPRAGAKIEADAERPVTLFEGEFASDDDDEEYEYEYEYEYEEVDDDDEEDDDEEDADDDADEDEYEYEYEEVDDDEEEDEEDEDDDEEENEWVEVDDDEIPDDDFEYADEDDLEDDDEWEEYEDDLEDDDADFEEDD